jgi:hypothetical protein
MSFSFYDEFSFSAETIQMVEPVPQTKECWEESLFCPAKDHPQPINDSIVR